MIASLSHHLYYIIIIIFFFFFFFFFFLSIGVESARLNGLAAIGIERDFFICQQQDPSSGKLPGFYLTSSRIKNIVKENGNQLQRLLCAVGRVL